MLIEEAQINKIRQKWTTRRQSMNDSYLIGERKSGFIDKPVGTVDG